VSSKRGDRHFRAHNKRARIVKVTGIMGGQQPTLEQLERRISELGSIEHGEILKMLPIDQVSTNENGAFCDLGKVDLDVLERISSFVDFSLANNARLAEYDKSVHTAAMMLHRPRTRDVPTSLPPFTVDAPKEKPHPVPSLRSATKLAFLKRSSDAVERAIPMQLLRVETTFRKVGKTSQEM
jgi:hypothetical protein